MMLSAGDSMVDYLGLGNIVVEDSDVCLEIWMFGTESWPPAPGLYENTDV